jgi:serine/threonine-protein kinase
MELIRGDKLSEVLARQRLPVARALELGAEIAAGLAKAHEKQIVHRDLKPDNVYLATVRGGFIMVKLLDFGIAKLTADGGIAKTNTGELMGTPAYLSPEQARGRNVDNRTDIYALGCMMYEMITGRLPFIAESAVDIIMMHVSAVPQKPSELKPDIPLLLEQTILQMLDKDPEKRPTLADVRNVFAELVASGLVQLEPGSGSTFRSDLVRTPRSSPRNQILGTASPAHPLVPSPPIVGTAASPEGRRRTPSPSEQPTSINFTPGDATITPSDRQPTAVRAAAAPRRGRGVLVGVLALVVAIPAGAIGYSLVTKKGAAPAPAVVAVAPADAAVAPPVVPADATLEAPAPAVAKRSVIVRASVPSAALEVDGASVESVRGLARLELVDGSHHLIARASGYTTFDKVVEVGDGHTEIIVKLERTKRPVDTTAASASSSNKTTPTTQTTTTTPPAGQGSAGSATSKKDATIDPFAQ